MTTAAQFQTKVTKAATNMDRFDGFVNGDENTIVNTDSGPVPSIQKLIADGLLIPGTGADLNQANIQAAITDKAAFRSNIQLNEAVDDRVASLVVAGSGITATYDDTAGTLTIAATGGAGLGDVVGPASSVDGRLALFDGPTGKLLKQAGVSVSSFATAGHTHVSGDITNFSEAVDDRVAALLVAGSNITLTYNDAAGTLTIASAGGGSDSSSIRPEDYGAVGDGSTNDATALQNAINAAISQNKPLRLSRNYKSNSSLTGSGGSLSVLGDGIQGSEIIFAANQGFVFNGGTPVEYDYATLLMRDIGLRVTGGVSTAAVLKVTASEGSGSTAIGFIADNLDISGQSGTDGFACGIELANVRNAAVTNCRILGDRDRGFAIQSGRGIKITSDTAEGTEITLTNNDIYFVDEAIEIAGTFEGGIIQGCTIVACYGGVNSYRTDGGGDPLVVVSNCHINTYRFGVRARNRFQSFINGCLFYAFDSTPSVTYIGVDLISEVGPTLNWQIIGNTFKGDSASVKAGKTAIRINGGASIGVAGGDKTSTIEANHFERLAKGIELGNYCSFVTVGPTNTYTDVDTKWTDVGAGNRIHYPMLRQPGTPTTLMIGSGAEDGLTDALLGLNIVPDADNTWQIGTALSRLAAIYTNILSAVGISTGTLATSGGTVLGGNVTFDETLTRDIGSPTSRARQSHVQIRHYGDGIVDLAGIGNPNGAITGAPGSTFRNLAGGANVSFWVKESGTGNTGWVNK